MNGFISPTPSLSLMLPLPTEAAAASGFFANDRPANLEQVGTDFEGLFYSLLLKEMRNSISIDDGGGLFAGENTDSLGGMFDLFLGQYLASSGQLGVGRMIAAYLANRLRAAE